LDYLINAKRIECEGLLDVRKLVLAQQEELKESNKKIAMLEKKISELKIEQLL